MSEDSGWTAALVDADIAIAGISDSFIKVANIKRTRNAHQVTVSVLYVLLQSAYAKYQQDLDDDDCALLFDDWYAQKVLQVRQFHSWYLTMKLELLLLIFLRSICQANFSCMSIPLLRCCHNYARWLSVHWLDMRALLCAHAIDQAHEQNHAIVKGDGGAVGLTENPSALRR